jgi:hypothetical protein
MHRFEIWTLFWNIVCYLSLEFTFIKLIKKAFSRTERLHIPRKYTLSVLTATLQRKRKGIQWMNNANSLHNSSQLWSNKYDQACHTAQRQVNNKPPSYSKHSILWFLSVIYFEIFFYTSNASEISFYFLF